MTKPNKPYKGILISSFNIDNFARYLGTDNTPPLVDAAATPFDQVIPLLLNKDPQYWQKDFDFAVVWTQPEGIIGKFNSIRNYTREAKEEILKEVDGFSRMLLNLRGRVKSIFVPTWVWPFYNRGLGMLDMKLDSGISNTLLQMNLRLAENLRKAPDVYLFDAQKWINFAGKEAFNPNLWYMAKVPFGNEVFTEAVKDIKCALNGISGNSKKLIVLDLDDTLWGGIVGDAGWENLKLGGHDPVGEAYLDFQRALLALKNRGILLAIVSKNEEAIALEAVNKHPEMVLKPEDFCGWKINWQDKARNVAELAADLNIGLQSVVFIDDSPAERARVREALPEVLVPEWPENKILFTSTLLSMRCFDAPAISREDASRTKMYVSERKRKELKTDIGSLEEWLKGLQIEVTVGELNKADLQRTAQLLNKTNQMNMATRRMTEPELAEWVKVPRHKLWIFRVSDKFGDSGLTGIVSLEIDEKIGKIADFVLSCRVIGRKVEEVMLATVIQHARSVKLKEVCAEYIPTPKNKPCLAFLKNSGLRQKENSTFLWDTAKDFKLPGYINIKKTS